MQPIEPDLPTVACCNSSSGSVETLVCHVGESRKAHHLTLSKISMIIHEDIGSFR